jgi:beta-lactamase class A
MCVLRSAGITLATIALVWAATAPSAAAGAPASWPERVAAAERYAQARQGTVSFAVIDESGHLYGRGLSVRSPSMSLLKVMLMAAYLRRPSIAGRPLTRADRKLLTPMIRWSDNVTAERVLAFVGRAGLEAVARDAGMRHFAYRRSPWGLSTTTAADQVRLWANLDRVVPARHLGFALRLLGNVVPSQRWGIPAAAPPGWRVFFKGGWGSGTGRLAGQSALLERDGSRIVMSVLAQHSPNHDYGTTTVRGVATRLLRGVE